MEFTGVTYTDDKITDNEVYNSLPTELKSFYDQVNGIIAFNGGLHIRGCVSTPDWHSIGKIWKGENALHNLYDEVKETDVPFGQDCLGDQYLLRDGLVCHLSAETGDIENLDFTFGQFLKESMTDPMEFLLLQPLQQFMNEGGQLKPGELLNVYPPFCTKEAEEGVSLKNVPTLERISFLADLYRQLKDLPEGQRIEIKIK